MSSHINYHALQDDPQRFPVPSLYQKYPAYELGPPFRLHKILSFNCQENVYSFPIFVEPTYDAAVNPYLWEPATLPPQKQLFLHHEVFNYPSAHHVRAKSQQDSGNVLVNDVLETIFSAMCRKVSEHDFGTFPPKYGNVIQSGNVKHLRDLLGQNIHFVGLRAMREHGHYTICLAARPPNPRKELTVAPRRPSEPGPRYARGPSLFDQFHLPGTHRG